MKKNLHQNSTHGVGGSQPQSKNKHPENNDRLENDARAKSAVLLCLTKCLQEKDDQAFQILKKHPRLIYKLGEAVVIYYPQWGPFRIFVINEKYLLYQKDKMIFSSWCKDVVQRNLMEWHYFFEKGQKDKQGIKSSG